MEGFEITIIRADGSAWRCRYQDTKDQPYFIRWAASVLLPGETLSWKFV